MDEEDRVETTEGADGGGGGGSSPTRSPGKSPRKKKRKEATKTVGAARFMEQPPGKRRKWFHRIRNRTIFNMKRLRLTTKAHCAFAVLPETLNAATYSTSGDFLDFVERFYMAIHHAQNMPRNSVRVDINEVLSVMDDEALLQDLKSAVDYARKTGVEQPLIRSFRTSWNRGLTGRSEESAGVAKERLAKMWQKHLSSAMRAFEEEVEMEVAIP